MAVIGFLNTELSGSEGIGSLPVGIIDDGLFESDETFFRRLTAASVLPPNVLLDPSEAVSTIIDNDRTCIWKLSACYLIIYVRN